VWRRQVDENNVPIGGVGTPWAHLGTTCYADELPGKNVLPIGEVLAAFRRVQFTKPELSIQPVGNLTLVNLPTYFETKYPQPGLGPGEIDESSLLGNRVQIRVLAQSLNYVYGDGSASGPTSSLGGPYPQGDIRYTYPRKGDFATRVDVTYGGQFRIGEGPWLPIPEVVTIEGTPEPLLVCEARARLVSEFDDRRTGNQFQPNTPCSIRAQQMQNQPPGATIPPP